MDDIDYPDFKDDTFDDDPYEDAFEEEADLDI